LESTYDYDLFVIGAGSGGVRAARMAGGFGARVAVCEERYLGGTCVNVGCVPKKLLVYGSQFRAHFADSRGFGWDLAGTPHLDWQRLIRHKDTEIDRLGGVYQRLLEGQGVEILRGHGVVTGPHEVTVDSVRYCARYILVATGSWPLVPEIPGAELAITSNEVFHLEELPRRVLVVGGGYIGVEFCGIFAGLGSHVIHLYRRSLFLRGFDLDVRHHLAGETRRKGIDVRFDCNVEAIARAPDGHLACQLDDGTVVHVDQVLMATGRKPLTAGLGLEAVGVALAETGAVVVDDDFRTSVPSILAVGDVIDRVQLTPVALEEGMAVAKTLFGGQPTRVDYDTIPTAVFSQPPIGTVGLTEEQARARYANVVIFKSDFRPMKHTLSGCEERTLMKLVVDGDSDRVLGVHVVGDEAAEIVQGFAVALKCGATKAQFDATVGIHPTAAEELVTMRTPVR
jgi:glutathione reductase (NADPH)